jgi:hypothetical protein
MNFQVESAQLYGKTLTILRIAWFVCAASVTIILLSALPGYYPHFSQAIRMDPYSLGQFNLPYQVLVGVGDLASGFMSLSLAALLFWRKPNDRMALFASFFLLISAPPSGISLEYFLTTYFGLPSVYLLGQDLQTPLWVLIFCIFPDGHFVPRWTRWLLLFSIVDSFSSFYGAEWDAISNILSLPLFPLLGYAQVHRYRRVSNYTERNQTKWVVFGFVVSIMLSLIGSMIQKQASPPLINIFPLSLTIAILGSHLWDIEIIIRKTLQYTVLTTLFGVIYFGSIVLLQRLVENITGQQSQIVIVISTLAIAALFNPLRFRTQDFIDRRFFRKKYDAEQTLARFALVARDEVDMDKLTTAMLRVVEESMQPEQVSLLLVREKRL